MARTDVLRTVGRKVLAEFLAKFEFDLLEKNITLPDPALPDNEYFNAVAALLQAPENLPERLNDAIFTVEQMAGPEGQEQLESAMAHAGLSLGFDADAPPERVTIQVWLQSPELVCRQHRTRPPLRPASFECFSSPVPSVERRPICVPDHASLQALTVPLVLWFAQHHRAMHTTRVDFHLRDHGQFWFLIRHGDNARWTRKIGEHETEFIRFTLEDEEAVFYHAECDELWISARTEMERELFRTEFGLSLRGNRDYFSLHRKFTLNPLRADGVDALYPVGIAEIRKMTLHQLQVDWEGGLHNVRTDSSDNLFASLAAAGQPAVSPGTSGGALTGASFLAEFADSLQCREVEIFPPWNINLQRPSDLYAVARWLSRTPFNAGCEQISETRRAAS
jgi:hypothetical protein